MKKNILITSIAAKVPLIQTLIESKNKFNKNISIYGGDIDENCIGKFFVDSFWLMPRLEALAINDFIAYCNEKDIRYIIPTRDADVVYFSTFKEKLFSNSIYAFVPNKESVNICFDKLKFYRDTKSAFIIPTFSNPQEIDSSNVVVKERFGSGSENIVLNVDKESALKVSSKFKEAIYQPYVLGEEFSIDAYVKKDGQCIAAIVRSRDIVKNGESQVTTFVEDKLLNEIVMKFLEELNIVGHSVTQVLKHENSYSIIECNTRFGGASTLSYKMGLESFYWFLLETEDKEISFELNKIKLKQVRVAEDKYFEC